MTILGILMGMLMAFYQQPMGFVNGFTTFSPLPIATKETS
jgi:hypothetical protein